MQAEVLTVARAGRQAPAMSLETTPPPARKLPILKIVIALVVLAIVGGIVLYLVGWRTAWDESKRLFGVVLELIAAVGPVAFFAAMAILPSVGAPMAPFAVMCGLAFRERLGLPLVLLLGVTAMTINIIITYWLARRWLRPPLTRLIERWGYKLPQVDGGDATRLIVLLRVTPGTPFCIQNYLLGLAEVPFGRYLVLSATIQGLLLGSLVVFGDALNQGKGKMMMLAAGALAAVMIGTHFVRKYLAQRKASA